MPRYLKKIWAGDVYEAKEYNSPRQKGKGCERAMRENISPEKNSGIQFSGNEEEMRADDKRKLQGGGHFFDADLQKTGWD